MEEQKQTLTKDINSYQRGYYEKNNEKKKRQHQLRRCVQQKSIVIPSDSVVAMLKLIYKHHLQDELKEAVRQDQFTLFQEMKDYLQLAKE